MRNMYKSTYKWEGIRPTGYAVSCLRQTMGQQRLNDVMLLHIHKLRTDQIDLKSVAQAFVMANDERIRYFGSPSR